MFLSRRCIHTTPLFTSMAGCISPSSRAHANFLASSVRGIPPTRAPLERELERSKAAIAPRKTHRAARAGCIMPIDAVTWSQRVERSRVRTVHDAEALRTYLLSSAAGAVAGGLLALTILRWHGLLRKSKTIAGAKDARYSRIHRHDERVLWPPARGQLCAAGEPSTACRASGLARSG